MNHPNLALMRTYGTAGVFFEKAAGGSPFAARVAAVVFSGAMIHAAGAEMDRQKMEAHQLNEQFRLAEQRMMEPINQSLRHTRAPMFVPAGSDLPVGWDEGMVRLASIARGAGEDMAKVALGVPPPLPAMAASHGFSGPPSPTDRQNLIAKIQGMKADYAKNPISSKPPTAGAPATLNQPPAAAALRSTTAPARPPVATQMSPVAPGATPAAAKTEHAAPGALASAAPGPKLQTPPVNKPLNASAPAVAGKGPGMMEGMLGKNWKGKALGYGALAGGGYLAMKGLNAGLGMMSRPAPAQQNWGAPGTELPMGVNSYGQPQLGTPLMG